MQFTTHSTFCSILSRCLNLDIHYQCTLATQRTAPPTHIGAMQLPAASGQPGPSRHNTTHKQALAWSANMNSKMHWHTHTNDPSAGSPTETLLQLLLPLNATVWLSSRKPGRVTGQAHSPRTSLKRSIGSSDGQCVQRAVTSPGTQMFWFPGSFLLSLKLNAGRSLAGIVYG